MKLTELHTSILKALFAERAGLFATDLIEVLQRQSYGLYGLRGSIYTPLADLLDAELIRMGDEEPPEHGIGLKRFRYIITDQGVTYATASDTPANPPPPSPPQEPPVNPTT